MNDAEFNREINRLASVYPKGAYPPERVRLIAGIVMGLPHASFARMIDELIGSSDRAPMVPKFAELAAVERERAWQSEKRENANDAKEFWHTSYSDDDRAMLFDAIKKRVTGELNDNDWNAVLKAMNGVSAMSRGRG